MSMEQLFEKQRLEHSIKVIDDKMEGQLKDAGINRLKEEYQKLKALFERNELQLGSNQAQTEAKENEIKNLSKDKNSMEELKYSRSTDSMKKLDSVDKQIEKIDEKLDGAEKNLIKLAEDGKTIEKDIDELKKKIMFIKRKYLASKEAVEKNMTELKESRKLLQVQLDQINGELDGRLDSELSETYQKLKRRYEDPVAEVVGRRCMGCKVELPSMEFEALRAGKGIIRCESCGRLLLYRSS